jgi:hypothetical protein
VEFGKQGFEIGSPAGPVRLDDLEHRLDIVLDGETAKD